VIDISSTVDGAAASIDVRLAELAAATSGAVLAGVDFGGLMMPTRWSSPAIRTAGKEWGQAICGRTRERERRHRPPRHEVG
jgi:hypothetical protein